MCFFDLSARCGKCPRKELILKQSSGPSTDLPDVPTPHLYLAQQCCVEGGLIVLLYPHSYRLLSRYSESFVVSWTSSEDFMEYLLNSHFLRTKWFICVRIFDISLYLWKVFNGAFIHILPINQNNVIQQ